MKLFNPEVRIETTNKCNSHCTMCPREKLSRPQGVMDLQLFTDILNHIKDYKIKNIFLGGYGEPLLDPHIITRVKLVKEMGFFVNFISNGSLMNEERAKGLIEAGLDEVRFSFYGTTKETYETIHKGLCYEQTKNNIQNLIALREQHSSKTPKVYVFFLMLDENTEQAEDFKREWEGVVDAIEIWKPHNFGNGRVYRHVNGNRESCGRPQRGPIQIQLDGTVIPCCWDYDGCMVLGDLKRNTLKDILRGEKFIDIRNAHNSGNFGNYSFCNNCDQLNKKKDALVYSTRHNLPPEEAVTLTNSSLFTLK